MVRRAGRIAQFISEKMPPAGATVQVLCEDHVGTYTLPFLCMWTDGGWLNSATLAKLDADVIGWRCPPVGASAERPMWASRAFRRTF